jgi:hypothetical protein
VETVWKTSIRVSDVPHFLRLRPDVYEVSLKVTGEIISPDLRIADLSMARDSVLVITRKNRNEKE